MLFILSSHSSPQVDVHCHCHLHICALRKWSESSDLGGLVLVQETQSAHFPSSNCCCPSWKASTTSSPQKMHCFTAFSRLDNLPKPSFWSWLHTDSQPELSFLKTVNLFFFLFAFVMPPSLKECIAVQLMRVRLSYFSWWGDWLAGLAKPGKSRYGAACKTAAAHFESQQPGHLALTHMPAHTLAPKQHLVGELLTSCSTPAYLPPFSAKPAHRAVTLRWPSHHLGGGELSRAYWICPEKQGKKPLHSVRS